jgi:hypothetical protein
MKERKEGAEEPLIDRMRQSNVSQVSGLVSG